MWHYLCLLFIAKGVGFAMSTQYPTKYWWLVLVVVPIAVAVISILGPFGKNQDKGSGDTIYMNVIGNQFTGDVAFNSVQLIIDQVQQIHHKEIPDSLVETLHQAIDLIQSKKFDEAIKLLQSVEPQAPVPALFNNLGAAYLASGNTKRANEYLGQVESSTVDTATAFNLKQLKANEKQSATKQPEDKSSVQPIASHDKAQSSIDSGVRWEIFPNPKRKGLGRIVVSLSDDVKIYVAIFKAGENEKAADSHGSKAFDLLPGRYDVKIFDETVKSVPVQGGMDTRIRMGIFSIAIDSYWAVFDQTKKIKVTDAHGGLKIALPVGKYFLMVAGSYKEIVIKDRLTTEF
jgi:hypothetical protein